MATGRGSLFLEELDELEAGVEEAVDAVGDASLFGAREAGGGGPSHAPGLFVNDSKEEDSKRTHLSQHMLVILWTDS